MIKIKIYISIFLLLFSITVNAQKNRDWENPKIIGVNKDQATATFSSYKDEVDAFVFKQTDYKIHGVGGDDSWDTRTHKKYTIDGNQPISFGFVFHPFKN